jgi:hypothetical protein
VCITASTWDQVTRGGMDVEPGQLGLWPESAVGRGIRGQLWSSALVIGRWSPKSVMAVTVGVGARSVVQVDSPAGMGINLCVYARPSDTDIFVIV